MPELARFYVVEASALPEVFLRVAEAKEYLNNGQAQSSAEASRMAGISRSAFYKYKDAFFPYNDRTNSCIITMHMILRDRPGVLSQVIASLYQSGVNILTINQNIPVMGAAPVSISVRTDQGDFKLEDLLGALKEIDGVQSIENVSGA
ncbi:ACT domain-containing protein [Solibaculum mannosilyticum]|uniref:UPF0735 ACT domain-containing protein C12CBH8_13230 n=1 Tax=Solibaculum mannosilyticum TaxID=2780922 RepID=A0A7I8D7S2_9FIRM|nr:ACT domain-containing protein [Solibaculum mannosilyticum]MCO7137011.1 ACT domain-containing protein [[Clostridium] leptum]BCI60684.1 hypothetical protein C12CBH8_13230 [Solibaculum mannosilyticum]CZT57717.1 hypothetical protein BN3661_02144 [Eubacteriaceae bacterium CHKCI005]